MAAAGVAAAGVVDSGVRDQILGRTARNTDGYPAGRPVHAEGSSETEKMEMLRALTANGSAEGAVS